MACVVAGCAGDNSSVAPAKPEKPSKQSPAARKALRDPSSAASTAVRFWRYVGAGAMPAAFLLYSDDVTRTVGPGRFGGMMVTQQRNIAALELQITDIETTNRGMVVFAEAIPSVGPKTEVTFFLMRLGGRWRIVYDSYSAVTFGAFVQDQVQGRVAPGATQPAAQAVRAGTDAAALFRGIALASLVNSRDNARTTERRPRSRTSP